MSGLRSIAFTDKQEETHRIKNYLTEYAKSFSTELQSVILESVANTRTSDPYVKYQQNMRSMLDRISGYLSEEQLKDLGDDNDCWLG